MASAVALIITDESEGRLGLPSRLDRRIGERSVLEHTVQRVARVRSVGSVVLVHPREQDPLSRLNGATFGKPVQGYADPGRLRDELLPMRRAARKWSLSAWRGGLAGAGCYDEILPAGPLVAAMSERGADSALLVGADWPLVDPDLCDRVLEKHLSDPESFAFTFTQAPPGLAGAAASRKLLEHVAEHDGTFGQMLSYNPSSPQADPIGRDPCVQIAPEVRSSRHRFIYDTNRSATLVDEVADRLGSRFDAADSVETAGAVVALDERRPRGFAPLPQQVTLELTPQRPVAGPIAPQHYVDLDRAPMPLDLAVDLVRQLGAQGDAALMLGGLGDALCHEHWFEIAEAAHDAGVLGIAIQTDLLVDEPVLERIVASPIDVVCVRLNADTAAIYESVSGVDRFRQVIENLQWLLTRRRRPRAEGDRARGLPWVVPHLVKTTQTLGDMETFFDRWVHFAGAAVIEPATTGCGLMPSLSPVRTHPPLRVGCRQLDARMTILSDGRVARCDQDWLGRDAAGDARQTPLAEIWRSMDALRAAHAEERWGELPGCAECEQWHRP